MQPHQVTVPALDIQASVAFHRGLGSRPGMAAWDGGLGWRLIVSSPHDARVTDKGSVFGAQVWAVRWLNACFAAIPKR